MPRSSIAGTFEECADELNDFVAALVRCPPEVLAHAQRAHLSGILQALLVNGRWTREEVAAFLRDLEQETLHPE